MTNPSTSSAPLIVLMPGTTNRSEAQAGSCFFVDSQSGGTIVVTAAHVVTASVAAGRTLAAAVVPTAGNVMPFVPVPKWHVRSDLDLAIGLLTETAGSTFGVFAGQFPINSDVATIEFSRSLNPHPTEPGNIVVTPLLRRGYVIQTRQGLHPDFPLIRMLELSYPALKGASGSPVFREDSRDVIGVVIANVERELMPAQVLRAVRDDGEPIEEIRYFLPNALAVSAAHLADILAEQVVLST